MINVWWFSRPKRRVTEVPSIIASVMSEAVGQEWSGNRKAHLAIEEALEHEGLKRVGDRRDQSGSGARTYNAWLRSYGFTFEYNGKQEFTLIAEDIMNGADPVAIMRTQVLKYQFPSYFSLNSKSRVTDRFKIRPYRFILRLLLDPALRGYITEKEIGYIVIGEAENETESCYRKVVNHILDYRDRGMASIPTLDEMNRIYRDGEQGKITYYTDIANTMINVFEYTQLVIRKPINDKESGLMIVPEAMGYIQKAMATNPPFIDRPEDGAYFQRKFGVGPNHQKDTRNLNDTHSVTPKMVMESQIQRSFIKLSMNEPIFSISSDVIDTIIADTHGVYSYNQVEDVVRRKYPGGMMNGFYSNYYQMAFMGQQKATEFEKATASLFDKVFGFETKHIGQGGSESVPDVILSTDTEGYQAIIDTKAYSAYNFPGDHILRMTHRYIPNINEYSFSKYPLLAYCYISGGFSKKAEEKLRKITSESNAKTPGSAFTVQTIIKLAERQLTEPVSHASWRNLLTSGKVFSPDMV